MNGYSFDDLSDQWYECSPDEATRLEEELRRETPVGHLLHGVVCTAVAKYGPADDVLCWLPKVKQWAVVHITWQVETDPYWPVAAICGEWADVCDELDDRDRR